MLKMQNKNIYFSVLLFVSTFLFLSYLNLIFPTQSDDIGRKIEGLQRAVQTYMTGNARFGELMLVTFGSYLSTKIVFAFINALIGTIVIFLIFITILGTLPKEQKHITYYLVLLLYLLFDPVMCFGSIFYWAAGSFNYLYCWLFNFLLILPCSFFWRYYANNEIYSTLQKYLFNKKQFYIIGIIIGILAGWSSEFAIVIICFGFITIVYGKIKAIRIPAWYYCFILALCIGWIFLYMSPGLRLRGEGSDYLSLISILKLGPIGVFKQLGITFNYSGRRFYFENLIFITLLFFAIGVSNKSKKMVFYLFLEILLMALPLFMLKRIFYSPIAFFICFFNSRLLKKSQNRKLTNYSIMLCGLFLLEFIYRASLIQITTFECCLLPRRACLQWTLINYVIIVMIISIFFEIIKGNQLFIKITSFGIVILSIILISFICIETTKMYKKWNLMEQQIAEQKTNGIKDIIVEKNTFKSKWWSYGDWGNPGNNTEVWPNTTYAKYYEVDTFVAY